MSKGAGKMESRQYRDDLIGLYASNKIDVIESVSGFKLLCSEFAEDTSFQADRHEIEKAKASVETALDQRLTQQGSVQKAIQLLITTRGDNKKRDLVHDLIVAGYRRNWTVEQQQYFDAAWEKIQVEYDYFLSFTCRYPPVAGDNPINTAYRQLIISEIGMDEFNKADRKKTNLLASTAYRLLSQPRIRGFYFPHSQYDNRLTEQKLEAACDSCMVFVQLVQSIMFDRPAIGRNYCFFEWNRVNARFHGADRERRILFVVAGVDQKDFQMLLPFVDYSDWHGQIRQKDARYLPEAQFWDRQTVPAIKKMFQEHLVPQIRAPWFRLIEDVPN